MADLKFGHYTATHPFVRASLKVAATGGVVPSKEM